METKENKGGFLQAVLDLFKNQKLHIDDVDFNRKHCRSRIS